jgi:hypothetical protein
LFRNEQLLFFIPFYEYLKFLSLCDYTIIEGKNRF